MNRYCLIALCTTLVGCEPPKPIEGFPPVPTVKNVVKEVPGPVDPDAPEEFSKTDSGLKYRIRRQSDGRKPTAKNSVRVHYRGQFEDGETFDTSYGPTGRAIEFPLSGPRSVIPGWIEGLQLIGEGGMIELEIPPDLAYGKNGRPPEIPPNATLNFLVELLDVK